MGKVTIYGTEQLKDFVNNIPESYLNNPAFLPNFISSIESTLYWKKTPVTIEISDNSQKITVMPTPDVERGYYNNQDPKSHISCAEYIIDNDKNLEIINTEGYLHDADPYYKRVGKEKPDYKITSVLDTYYTRKLIDKDGIEVAQGTFYKDDWPLTNVRYDDILSFSTQLLSDGKHKPAKWSSNGPELPQFAYNAHVSGLSRSNDNPAFAHVYGYDTEGPSKAIVNYSSFIGVINTEYPDELRVDDFNKIARFEGESLVLYDPYNNYENRELPDIFREKALDFEQALDKSKSNRENRQQIQILKEKMEEANKKYKNQEVEQGRSI